MGITVRMELTSTLSKLTIGEVDTRTKEHSLRMDRFEVRQNQSEITDQSHDVQLKYIHEQQEKSILITEKTNDTLIELIGSIRELRATIKDKN